MSFQLVSAVAQTLSAMQKLCTWLCISMTPHPPSSHMQLLETYKQLLARKREQLTQARQRLESGVDKITSVSGAVLP